MSSSDSQTELPVSLANGGNGSSTSEPGHMAAPSFGFVSAEPSGNNSSANNLSTAATDGAVMSLADYGQFFRNKPLQEQRDLADFLNLDMAYVEAVGREFHAALAAAGGDNFGTSDPSGGNHTTGGPNAPMLSWELHRSCQLALQLFLATDCNLFPLWTTFC